MASSPPTAATEPEAARAMLEMDVTVPDDAESEEEKASDALDRCDEDVRKPDRMSDVISEEENLSREIL